MDNWITYPTITTEDATAAEIIKTLFACKEEFFGYGKRETPQTQLIKKVLRVLGESKGYSVWANRQIVDPNGHVSFVNREWLYDLHWYTDEEHFLPTSLPLVVESQWRPQFETKKVKKGEYNRTQGKNIPYSGVMFDFQKLLVTNASLRLMLFKISKMEDLEYMKNYFKTAIAKYPALQIGDPFLIVAYCARHKQIHHLLLRKIKSPSA
jgi:hypothetical protein